MTLSSSDQARFTLEHCTRNPINLNQHQDLIDGLNQPSKSIPSRYFYDDLGSQLFEQICSLPEYYPTRTEAKILQELASSIAKQTGSVSLVELGSGSSTKTRYLLDAYNHCYSSLHYIPIDISGSILKDSALSLLADYPKIIIDGKVGTYEECLANLSVAEQQQKMILFLGSTIGNFDPEECDLFLDLISNALNSGDYFLLGLDLQKPKPILEAAYNDSQSITAQFNLNILQHLNWKFQSNFDLNLFEHQAIYNEQQNQIEMYLVSQQAQSIDLGVLDLTIQLAPEEKILTEISRKFDVGQISQILEHKNLSFCQSYTDEQKWFSLLLFQQK